MSPEQKAVKKRTRIPIAIKLVIITMILMVTAILPVTLKSTRLFEDFSSRREGDMNSTQVGVIAKQVQDTLQSIIDKTKIVGGILYKDFPNEADRQGAIDLSFRSDRDLISVEVMALKDGKPVTVKRVVNDEYLKQYDLKNDFIDTLRATKQFPLARVFAGDVEIRNSSIEGGAPLLTMGIPLVKDDSGNITDIALADFRLDRLEKLFSAVSANALTFYLVDHDGRLLAHPDERLALTAKKVSNDLVLDAFNNAQKKNGGKIFTDENGEQVDGVYAKTVFGVTVFGTVPRAIILASSNEVKRTALMITGVVLSIALFFIVWFSMTLTRPLEVLVSTTEEVARGNFNAKAEISTTDEVGELANAFNNMVDGLKERDKVKSLFNKFHGTGIANKLMTGEMKLGGEQREATVFFSDIRNFTGFSEEVTPREVVEMLNEYFKIMVGIVQKHHGVVDKFIGDAIMAVWGAPESFGNDAEHALKACIEMRLALAELNETRKTRGAAVLHIGMGVHTGPLIAGTIGSDDRMEYTVIGDTVNMASRIEAATKAFGSDLLISEETFQRVKDRYVCESVGEAELKGKTGAMKLFKVVGYVDENGQQINVQTPYSSYEAEHADKVKIAG